jgi:two-component system, cell cycle response regulator DivK
MERSRPLVLVVEDYEDARALYMVCLARAGFRVAEARDGMEALSLAESLVPDAIIMDISMPNLDGAEAMRRLKENPATRHIPVVVVTGGVVGPEQRSAWDAFLSKPCTPEDLVASVRRVLGSVPNQK